MWFFTKRSNSSTSLEERAQKQELSDKRHDDYLREHDIKVNIKTKQFEIFDATMLKINTGALLVSFAYLVQLNMTPTYDMIVIFTFGLGSFALSIIATIIDLLFSIRNCSLDIEVHSATYKEEIEEITETEKDKFKLDKRAIKTNNEWIRILNYAQATLTILGIILMGTFSYKGVQLNYNNKSSQTEQCTKEKPMSVKDNKTKNQPNQIIREDRKTPFSRTTENPPVKRPSVPSTQPDKEKPKEKK